MADNRPVAAWTGPVNTFDPARAPLRDGEPDYNVHPYHPRGTWRRALLFLSLGYRPSAEDLAALAEWNTLDKFQKREALDHSRDQRAATISAAREALEPGEVLGADALGRRIGGAPGVPHARVAATILRALPGGAEWRGAGLVWFVGTSPAPADLPAISLPGPHLTSASSLTSAVRTMCAWASG